MTISRRSFIQMLSAAMLPSLALRAAGGRPPRLLLRSSWQTVNIGDIGHTPGVLALLERYFPEMEVSLYPKNVDNGVAEMLLARFPRLRIVQSDKDISAAYRDCDFFLHGSGPHLVGYGEMQRWRRKTGKPFGVYGVTYAERNPSPEMREVLDAAAFLYFRDSVSLEAAQNAGLKAPLGWSPDGAFAVDLRNDAAAEAYLKAHGLEEGKFLCCIPRLRSTPYWLTDKKGSVYDAKKDRQNQEKKEHDHAPLREAILSVIAKTDLKILLCPEDSTQMAVNKEMILDKLPPEARERVVWREKFWLTDEALSTYVRSAGLFGNEMHSPIMCIGNGIPAIVCRWKGQTSKGIMWRDIGLGDWLFDLDREDELARVAPTVLAMALDPQGSRERASKAREFVNNRFRETMAVLGRSMDIEASA